MQLEHGGAHGMDIICLWLERCRDGSYCIKALRCSLLLVGEVHVGMGSGLVACSEYFVSSVRVVL